MSVVSPTPEMSQQRVDWKAVAEYVLTMVVTSDTSLKDERGGARA